MADLYWTHCNGCHAMADCLPHEDEFLCVGGDDEEGCYNRIRDAQMAQAREDYLRRERLEKCEAEIRASQEELRGETN